MSNTKKAGKRFWRRPKSGPSSVNMAGLIYKRQAWGTTEKIRRRVRKLWDRLFGKERRRLDKEAIKESGDGD